LALPIIIYDIDQGDYGNQSRDTANDGIHVFHGKISLAFNPAEEGNIKVENQKRTYQDTGHKDKNGRGIE
jgi:hypothetical protein